jgi:hypothetical protein
MGLEVGGGSAESMAQEVRSEDPVGAVAGACEARDLGGREAEAEAATGEGQAAVADSNGHVTEGEAARIGLDGAAAIEPVAGVEGAGDAAEGSRSQAHIKNWSDFNAVSARTFGEQRFGSFSDFLADQAEFPVDAAPASSGALELGSDVDFFEWGGLGSEPLVGGGLGVASGPALEPPAVAVAEEALGDGDERPLEAGPAPSVARDEPAPAPEASADDLFGIGQEAGEVAVEGSVVRDGAGEAGAESADPYPGWYYDYQAGEWRQVEGYSPIPAASADAGYGGDHVDSHHAQHMQTISETSDFLAAESPGPVEQAGVAAAEAAAAGQSQAWDGAESAATQTVADEYPGWTWDYAAQMWVATPGYNESWQSAPETQSQAYSGQESWYGQQEQQTQTYSNEGTVLAQNENPVAASQQPQSYFPGYSASDRANVMASGYASQVTNPGNAGSAYAQESEQWQGQVERSSAGEVGASNFYSPHVNGDQGWAGSGYVQQGQFGGQTESYPASEPRYDYAPNGGPSNYLQQQNQQQPWGNASHFNPYGQYTNPTAPPPKSVQEAMRTCSGRAPHSLAAFGFGGKLILMKHRDPVTLHTSDGDQVCSCDGRNAEQMVSVEMGVSLIWLAFVVGLQRAPCSWILSSVNFALRQR